MIAKIVVSGCDDMTMIVTKVTEEQFKFIKSIAKKITKASTYMCMPTMKVLRATERDEEDF